MTTKRKRLTAKTKYNIFLKTRSDDAPVGEILREYGIHLSDLKKIEEAVEEGAIANLKKNSKSKRDYAEITVADYKALQRELETKEKALADLSVEFMILKKNDV